MLMLMPTMHMRFGRQVTIQVTVQLVHKQGTTLCRRHDLIVPRSCRRYLLLMLIGLGCAVVPSCRRILVLPSVNYMCRLYFE